MSAPPDAGPQDELLLTAAAFGTRHRLDCLLLEALTSPGMATGPVERIVELAGSGELTRAQRLLDERHASPGTTTEELSS